MLTSGEIVSPSSDNAASLAKHWMTLSRSSFTSKAWNGAERISRRRAHGVAHLTVRHSAWDGSIIFDERGID